MSVSSHVSKRDLIQIMKLGDDSVGELLTISRAIVNMLELLSTEPANTSPLDGNTENAFQHGRAKQQRAKQQRRSSRSNKRGGSAKSSSSALQAGNSNMSSSSSLVLQRVHAAVQVDHLTCPSLFPSMLQRPFSQFDRSDLAISRTVRCFHIEPDIADVARCVLYSGEFQRQLHSMFQLQLAAAASASASGVGGVAPSPHEGGGQVDEGIEPLKASGLASQTSNAVSATGTDASIAARLLCRRRGTTLAPSAPPPSNEIMLSVPCVRVRHNRTLNPVVVTMTPTHLHVRDPMKDFVQKLPWSHLTSATLGTGPSLHAFIGGQAKQSLANISCGPRHGLLWSIARHEAQQSSLPAAERKKINLAPTAAMKQGAHCVNLQFTGMNIHKDSPVTVDTTRMTAHHVNELWRFELVCECEDDFALMCTFLTMIGNYQTAMWAVPGVQPWTGPAAPTDRPPKISQLKLRVTTLPEIDSAVPGGLSAWNKQQEGSAGRTAKNSLPPQIALSEAFFRMAHTDKYSRPVSLRYPTRAEIPTGIAGATSQVALQPHEIDFCTENHIGRVEYLVLKQLLLGDPLNRWISIADVVGHMMVPLRAWNLSPAIKLLRFFCDNGWLERVLVLEPGPRRR